MHSHSLLSSSVFITALKNKIDELANKLDPEEAAHNEPPYLDLHCLHFSL